MMAGSSADGNNMALLLAIEHFDYMLIVLAIGLMIGLMIGLSAGYLCYMIGTHRGTKKPSSRRRAADWPVLEIGQTPSSKKYHNPEKPCSALKFLRRTGATKEIGPCGHCFPSEPE